MVDTPYFVVDFGGSKFGQQQPVRVMVRQKEYAHDVVQLTFTDVGIGRRKYRKGAPVIVRWGWAPKDIETFYGYVHSSKLVHQKGQRPVLEVYLVGSSFRANETRMQTYLNLGVVPLIAQLARRHRFTLRSDPSSRYHRHTPQLGRSDFKLMCDLAKDIGFTLSVKRTEVQFKRRVIDQSESNKQPTFRYALGYGPLRGTLFSFVMRAGSAPLAKNHRLVFGGYDDNGKPYWAGDSGAGDEPFFSEYQTQDANAPSSIAEGRELLSGLSGLNRFYVQATVTTSGAPRLRCGQTVRFTNVGEEVAGYWWTGQVEHVLEGGMVGRPVSYRCMMEVGRETVTQVVKDEGPPSSWSGKPEVPDAGEPEVPTQYSPVDDCTPLEQLSVSSLSLLTRFGAATAPRRRARQ